MGGGTGFVRCFRFRFRGTNSFFSLPIPTMQRKSLLVLVFVALVVVQVCWGIERKEEEEEEKKKKTPDHHLLSVCGVGETLLVLTLLLPCPLCCRSALAGKMPGSACCPARTCNSSSHSALAEVLAAR